MIDPQIKKIARDTRKWCMRHRYKVNVYCDLCGMCAIAAGELHKRLTHAGFDSKIALRNKNFGHAFVICEGHIVDVTATQFSWKYKAVEIVPLSQKKDRPTFWRETAKYKSVDDLIYRQKKSGWPNQQHAWKETPRRYVDSYVS